MNGDFDKDIICRKITLASSNNDLMVDLRKEKYVWIFWTIAQMIKSSPSRKEVSKKKVPMDLRHKDLTPACVFRVGFGRPVMQMGLPSARGLFIRIV